MTTGISSFDTSIIKTKEWIKDVKEELHLDDEQQAYLALRGVLHVVRDRMVVNEAADLGAQLPMLLRGVYYEGWRPAGKPEKIRHMDAFLEAVSSSIPQQQHPVFSDPARLARAVFKVIDKHVSGGEVKDVRLAFPKEIQSLWPQAEEV